jgi:hypothetical protein
VVDVQVSDLFLDTDDPAETGYHYVWGETSVGEQLEKRLARSEDLETWFDATGYDWSPEARKAVKDALEPRPDRTDEDIIDVGLTLDDMRDKAVASLVRHNSPPVFFRRGGLVTEITYNEDHFPSIGMVSGPRMRERLAEVAYWEDAKGKRVKPPADLPPVLLATPELHLPPLDMLVEVPVMSRTGHISTRRGYDSGSETFFAPSVRLGRLTVSAYPSRDEVRAALKLLQQLVGDFPFRTRADKVNWLGLMLTPILRPIIQGPVPMAGIRAARAGSGKTLLVQATQHVLMGHTAGFTGIGRDSDEAEKRITAKLLAGGQFVVLDNVKNTLDLGPLEAALTEPTWEGRIITTSKWVTLKNRATWIATGNGLTLGEEMARRVYMIELESKLERPADRPPSAFRHHPLIPWVMAERPRLLSAVLTIVSAWAASGMHLTEGQSLGSFEEWAGVVGSVLRFAGLSEFLANEGRKREVAEDDTPINRETLLLRMREAAGDADFTLRELHQQEANNPDLAAAAAPFLGGVRWEDDAAVTKLGNELRPVVDGVYGGLTLIRQGKNSRRGGRLFRIVQPNGTV